MDIDPIDKLFDHITIATFAVVAQLAGAMDEAGLLSDEIVSAIHAHIVPVAAAAEDCDPDSDVLPFLDAAIEALPPRR